MAIPEPPSSPPPPLADELEVTPVDPPPPYPSRERRIRTPRTPHETHARAHTSNRSVPVPHPHNHHHHHHHHTYSSSSGSYLDTDSLSHSSDDEEPTETTPMCPRHQHHHHGRARAHSFASNTSSFTHTVLSIFQTEEDDGAEDAFATDAVSGHSSQRRTGFFSRAAWRRYFRPVYVRAYYRALLHLLVINFPYGLVAWIYLFVFTVTGTILLVALPLGAVLCFFNLLGARAFSRGELALQARFHGPLAHALPYPPRPIFTRYRPLAPDEMEAGNAHAARHILVAERSFYKNTYAMFTDPTSYQALFYFLVVKPAITLLVSIGIIALALPAMILIIPAPAVLRAVRRIGIWQANVAVEGLYVPVR